MSRLSVSVGNSDEALDERLNRELDAFNARANPEHGEPQELTVRADDGDELVAGLSGWTWGQAAGIAMTWVREDQQGNGLGARLVAEFEDRARTRGCSHVYVTSFTFQAPAFYEKLGYSEIFRWYAVPAAGRDDVHLRKEL